MIVKVKSRKRPSFKALLNYMVHNKDRLFDGGGKSLLITHNIKGNTLEDWVQQFKHNETFRMKKRIDSVYCTHEILSWHRNDSSKVTTKKLEDIARAYIKLRNPQGMYIVVPHFDKDHYHLHICASGIEYRTGRSLRLSKSAFGKLKLDIQKFQKERFPELEKSVVDHGAKKDRREMEKRVIRHNEKDKQYLSSILIACYKKANSIKTFDSLIQEFGLKTYQRSGRLSGVVFNERKYRLQKFGFSPDWIKELEKLSGRRGDIRKIRLQQIERTRIVER